MTRWLLCKVLGHRWRHLRVNVRKNVNLMHLSTMAGYESVCDRCGYHWNDVGSVFFGDKVVEISQPAQPLPVARALP